MVGVLTFGRCCNTDILLVEEFNPKPPRRKFFSRKPKVEEQPPANPHILPSIPDGWEPSSVSVAEKLQDVKRRARKVDGFPQSLEHVYTPEEMEAIRTHEEYIANVKLQQEARALVEVRERRPYSELTRAEIQAAQVALGIDPYSGVVTQQPTTSAGDRPVISRLFGKRKAEDNPAGKEGQASKFARLDVDGSEDDNTDFEGDLFGEW